MDEFRVLVEIKLKGKTQWTLSDTDMGIHKFTRVLSITNLHNQIQYFGPNYKLN